MTNCKNCVAPIDIHTIKCPYCETSYEAPGSSETGENFGREKIQSDYVTATKLDSLNKRKDELKTKLAEMEKAIGSMWIDEDFIGRASKYARGESLLPKWSCED